MFCKENSCLRILLSSLVEFNTSEGAKAYSRLCEASFLWLLVFVSPEGPEDLGPLGA